MTTNDIIIQASDLSDVNSWWENLGSGSQNFSVGLVPADGLATAAPPTNYIASGPFESTYPGCLFNFQAAFPTAVLKTFTGTPKFISDKRKEWLADLNLQKQINPI